MDEKKKHEALVYLAKLSVKARKKKHGGSLSEPNRRAVQIRWARYRASKKLSTDESSGN